MRPLLLSAFVIALPLLAQPPRGFYNWWDSPVAKDLNLTAEQTTQIRSTVREYRSKLIDERAALEKAEADLNDLFNDETLDQRKANETLERLITARGELTRTFTQMSLRLRAVLTADQFKELQKRRPPNAGGGGQMMRGQMQQRRMEGRQGGPGPGPGMNMRRPPNGATPGPAQPQQPPPPQQ